MKRKIPPTRQTWQRASSSIQIQYLAHRCPNSYHRKQQLASRTQLPPPPPCEPSTYPFYTQLSRIHSPSIPIAAATSSSKPSPKQEPTVRLLFEAPFEQLELRIGPQQVLHIEGRPCRTGKGVHNTAHMCCACNVRLRKQRISSPDDR